MANIRPNALPNETNPSASDVVIIDGLTTRKTSLDKVVNAGRPNASQAEAEAGVEATKGMTPLTTRQAIVAYGPNFAPAAKGVPIGGTTNQVLAKNSGTDNDLKWTNAGAGDVLSVNDANDFNSKPNVRKNLSLAVNVADRAAMKALDTTKDTLASVREQDRLPAQSIVVNYADFSALVDADTQEGVFARSTFDPTKAWKKGWNGALDVRMFGAKPDDTWTESSGGSGTNNYVAFQKAIDFALLAGFGEIYAPGMYAIEDTLVIDTDKNLIIYGDGHETSRIRQAGAGKDLIKLSTTQFLKGSGFRDIALRTMATAGHVVKIGYGLSGCLFQNVNMWVGAANKHLWHMYASEGAVGGIFDTKWTGGTWYCAGLTNTEHGVDFVVDGTKFNENVFEHIRVYYAQVKQFFRIFNTHTSTWLSNNRFENLNFEICKGGGLLLYNAKGNMLANIAFWDNATYSNHLIQFASNPGLESIANTLENVTRNGDALAPGFKDIYLQAAQDTTLINCYTDASVSPAYDWNNKRVYIIGLDMPSGSETNVGNRFYVNPKHLVSAWGTCNAAGALLAGDKVAFSKIVAGHYRMTFSTAKANTNYRVAATHNGTAALMIVVDKQLTYVDIKLYNPAGTLTDVGASLDITVFG